VYSRRVAAPRVILAEADEPVRLGLRAALEADGFEIGAEPASADDAVAAARDADADLCLLDVELAGGGIAAAARISREAPAVAVVMLAAVEDEREVIDAVRAGASGYLLKGMDPPRLPAALRGVLAGEAAVPRRLTAKVIDALRERRGRAIVVDGRRVALSQREHDVLSLLGEDLPPAEIAQRLGISPVTVRRHVSDLRRKLGVRDRAALRRLAEGQRGA
jgi:DNA-binding NarL/FixJ family response regulator